MSHTLDLPEAHRQLLAAKMAKGLTFDVIAQKLGKDEIWVAAAFYGQAKFTPEELTTLVELLDLPPGRRVVPHPRPGSDAADGSARLFRGIMVYGHSIKAVIHEKFGDGIMSMIDCTVNIARKADPTGDRVVLTFDGKFLPYAKW
ncbi:cyanate lyase C-terminal domain-containing protein [Mycena filopes]|nr:cyanate lyase C-terminal domain-containing protein [Mycena filopes]